MGGCLEQLVLISMHAVICLLKTPPFSTPRMRTNQSPCPSSSSLKRMRWLGSKYLFISPTRHNLFPSQVAGYRTHSTNSDATDMTIINLPKDIILEILKYITDQSTLANIALTCKTLSNEVSLCRYHTFPVPHDEVANCSMRKLHEKFAHLKGLSTRNVGFIRHLVIDPITDLRDPAIDASLRGASNCTLLRYISPTMAIHPV